MKIKNKALFLDRDGVINKNYGYVFSTKNFVWLKNVKKAIKYAYSKKYLIDTLNYNRVSGKPFTTSDIYNKISEILEDKK